jgi:hypothetical protein
MTAITYFTRSKVSLLLCRAAASTLLNCLLSRKMGFDCGFDTYPALKPTPSKKNMSLFCVRYCAHIKVGDEAERRDSVVRVMPKSNGAYIEFIIGKHPAISYNCEHFLRFSSKILNGTRILSEPPIFKVPGHSTDTQAVEGIVIKELKDFSKDQYNTPSALEPQKAASSSRHLASIILAATTRRTPRTPNLNQHTIHAFKDVEGGEEITISYLDGSESYTTRAADLEE